MVEHERVRQQIVQVCRWLHQKNMLAAADGNVSCRLDDQNILITPSGRPKGFIQAEEIAKITLQGEVVEGKPSSEKTMHLEVYKRCQKAQAVVHAHPPACIAWSIVHPDTLELPEAMPEVILATGGIPLVPYARPGTVDMGACLQDYLPQFRAMVLSRHGGLSWGESLQEAYMGMERIEHSAHVLCLAQALSPIRPLPSKEVESLKKIRQKMGPYTL